MVALKLPENPPVILPVETDEEYGPEVIRVEGVYKEYNPNRGKVSLRYEAGTALQRMFGRYIQKPKKDPFYAIRNLTFSVRKGEIVGVVGRNGSGKTTLLRLLSGVTRPTMGSITVDGRFAALIGLSAGFNPEMTGRKNIYLNAAIFGVPPHKIRPLEQSIIDFSEIEEFIDRPVKLYSSGMQARLGFSIAIHILPDIVFLDEVLSVGDAHFVKKCSDRILALKDERRTIIVVSHSYSWITTLCKRVIWLHNGSMMMDGPTDVVLQAYSKAFSGAEELSAVAK